MADTVQEFVFNLTFPFSRTLGSTLSTFASALAQGQIIGVRTGGRVIAPPLEYDPETAADAGTEWVRVGPKEPCRHGHGCPNPRTFIRSTMRLVSRSSPSMVLIRR